MTAILRGHWKEERPAVVNLGVLDAAGASGSTPRVDDDQEIVDAHGAVAIEVGGTRLRGRRARSPGSDHRQQVIDVHGAIAGARGDLQARLLALAGFAITGQPSMRQRPSAGDTDLENVT
jgi:hypothetical protein